MNDEYYSSSLIAIIGDIKESKKLNSSNRGFYQRKLKEELDKINKKYKEEIQSNFVITLGDEFQGVLKSATVLFEIIEMVQFVMDPILMRFGIGIGKIFTDINRLASIGADGPAYHRARNSISMMKDSRDDIQNIYLDTADPIKDFELNSHLYWVCNNFNNWTQLQRNIIKYKETNPSLTQTEIASLLKINQSLVSRSLKASRYDNYVKSKISISQILENILKEMR